MEETSSRKQSKEEWEEVTFSNIKRGLVRLWIVVAGAVDIILAVTIGVSTLQGFPLGGSWTNFLLVFLALHMVWFGALAMVIWVLNGFFSQQRQ